MNKGIVSRSYCELLCLTVLLTAGPIASAADWPTVSSQELGMTSEPKASGASAVMLDREIDRDDRSDFRETEYRRIKILTQEGLAWANVRIEFHKGAELIRGIEARTIHPDGRVVEFRGKVFEQPVLEGGALQLAIKTFTLPDVQVGSIVEFRFQRLPVVQFQGFQRYYVVPRLVWLLNDILYTEHAKFELLVNPIHALRWRTPRGLPPGVDNPKMEKGAIRLEVHDVPAFVLEDHMPPADDLKSSVDFTYLDGKNTSEDPTTFWTTYAEALRGPLTQFLDKPAPLQVALAGIVQPGDSSEVALRKIYARVQRLRNLSFEPSSEHDEAGDVAIAHDSETVWKRGYGTHDQLNLLFAALARTAGLKVNVARLCLRNQHFFNYRLLNPSELNTYIAVAHLDGKDLYLDPGVPLARFGELLWTATAVQVIEFTDSAARWTASPLPVPSDSRIERTAVLSLDPSGTVAGTLTVAFTGQEALVRRMQERNHDEAARRQFLVDEVKRTVPVGADIKLTAAPDWSSGEVPLVAQFSLSIPGWMKSAGSHQLLATGLFGATEKHTFEHAERVHPLYFEFPYAHEDDVTINLPGGWKVSGTPPAHETSFAGKAFYKQAAEAQPGSLHLKRYVSLGLLVVPVDQYSELRNFYDAIRTGDEDEVVLSAAANSVPKVASSP
jgi:hypothetical protein